MKDNVMKNENASERAAALVLEAVDVLQRVENAPDSQIDPLRTADVRRKYRRAARRLREQKSQPPDANLHSAEALAESYERAVQRDEIVEKGARDFKRITQDLGRLLKENLPEVQRTMEGLTMEAKRLAEEQGPGSHAALRYRCFEFLAWFGLQAHAHRRHPRAPFPWKVPPPRDPSIEARKQLTTTTFLDAPPEGEAVIAIPPEGSGSGRPRILIHIGVGQASWIGSFEAGGDSFNTIALMPDGKHLFVSVDGAGYIIELQSRTLVEQIGTEVTGVMTDNSMTFVVVHNGRSLEAFGRDGRLWKTGTIGCERIRHMDLGATTITGEGMHPLLTGWTNFSVDLATGKVRFGDPLLTLRSSTLTR
jgi:hypothetical protein